MSSETQQIDDSRDEIRERHREARDELLADSYDHYIGGEWVESASDETFETHDPTTGEVLAEAQAGNSDDIDRAVEAAWDAYESEWADTDGTKRQRLLTEIADRIEENRGEIARIETLDNGKPIREARADVALVADQFRYFAGAVRTHGGETVPSGSGKSIQTLREPYGVIGAVVPWNFPLLIASWKLAPALAAGNCVVLKPAEQTPLSILRVMEEIDDVLPDGVVNVVTGYGEEAGAPLTGHSDVRKVSFTGSTAVGKEVMKAAAENVADVTLELGGKSPVVVFPDADVQQAVRVMMLAMFYNTGECCTAGTRLFVHEEIYEEFMDAFVESAERLQMGDPLSKDTRLGPKVSEEQVERTLSCVEQAREDGARIVTGGGQPENEALADGCFVVPTVIDDIDHDSKPVQEEIFGPVEEVFAWSDYDEMIERANDVDYGLAAGIITNDLSKANRAARDIEAGNIWVNQYNDFPAGQPFGGFKQSGIGREQAEETLDHYSQTKTINMNL
ncbi:aldehyde dehydrogenase family protein [Halococcus dombrowskii]|uniref:Aldehyde dehydrogenase DhaS n=1 Tax=Halococcus dombrowskii TaxID=179637 RepID=A0AAV3SE39_HALDO|nr:aldehyde dehydrogenase family protein [Halococcus dombrowskii]UOO94606.1 aldehyde dehydrogenase family protein [Halococcus dombrowskii]